MQDYSQTISFRVNIKFLSFLHSSNTNQYINILLKRKPFKIETIYVFKIQ